MHRLVRPVLAACLLLGTTTAHAGHVQGECRVVAASVVPPSPAGEYAGVITGEFAHAGDIEVLCWIQVNGVRETATDLFVAGTGVAANALDIRYRVEQVDVVELCTEVVQPAPGHTTCVAVGTTELPPPILDEVKDTVVGLAGIAGAVLCPVLGGLAPGVPGVVDIDRTGDVSVAGTPVWDCPPYAGGTGSPSGVVVVIHSS